MRLVINVTYSHHLTFNDTERFIFNDKEISEDDLIQLLIDVERTLGNDEATLFEILTCAFYKYAENFKDNVNIIESGLFFEWIQVQFSKVIFALF